MIIHGLKFTWRVIAITNYHSYLLVLVYLNIKQPKIKIKWILCVNPDCTVTKHENDKCFLQWFCRHTVTGRNNLSFLFPIWQRYPPMHTLYWALYYSGYFETWQCRGAFSCIIASACVKICVPYERPRRNIDEYRSICREMRNLSLHTIHLLRLMIKGQREE